MGRMYTMMQLIKSKCNRIYYNVVFRVTDCETFNDFVGCL